MSTRCNCSNLLILLPGGLAVIKDFDPVVIIAEVSDPTASPKHCHIDGAVTPDLFFFVLNVLHRSLGAGDALVSEDQVLGVLAIHAVDIFQRAVGGFGVEEIDDGHEGAVENGPYDIELPLKALDSGRGDFHHYPLISAATFPSRGECGNVPIKLKIQLVAVPMAAPFVLILSELISVG